MIASDINGCREIFENGVSGLAFLPQNADSLTETIERFLLLAPEERAEMGLRREPMWRRILTADRS